MMFLIAVQFIIAAMMFFLVHMTKHWKLFLLPSIFREFEMKLAEEDIVVYIMLSYLSFFYGNLVGGFAWNQLTHYLNHHTSRICSLLMLGIFTYMQAINGEYKAFLIFRFLTGFSLNLENINKSFVHEFFSKDYRQRAFFVESGSHTFGTLASPLIGLFLYHRSKTFVNTCFVITVILFVTVALYIVVFLVIESKKKSSTREQQKRFSLIVIQASNEENIPFKRRGTVIVQTWRAALAHIFWTNSIARNLLIVYLVNASCFHVNLVLTSTFFAFSGGGKDFDSDENMLALGNLLGGIGSLFSIYYLSTLDKEPRLYKIYMFLAIMISVISLIICPFVKYALMHFSRDKHKYFIYVFFIFKEFVSFYMYNEILHHLIMVSIHKLYRKKMNFVEILLKALFHGSTFTIIMPLFYLCVKNETLKEYYPFNYAICFWLLALIQLATLPLFEYMKLPLEKRSI